MKKIIAFAFLIVGLGLCTMKFSWLYGQNRSYSDLLTDYSIKGNIDERYGFITGLNKIEFATFFTTPEFVGDILVPLFACASSGEGDFERCQSLLVAIIRQTREQALSYYAPYAQAMGTIARPYQVIRVLQDLYAQDPKKIAKALYELVTANPALALLEFKGDALDFGMMQYAQLKHVTSILKNPADVTWLQLLQRTAESWRSSADLAVRSKVINFSNPDIVALAKFDDFELARAKAIDPQPLLTTENLAKALGLQDLFYNAAAPFVVI